MIRSSGSTGMLTVLMVAGLMACGQQDVDAPGTTVPAAVQQPEAVVEEEGAALLLAVAQTGNEARYRIREQLVGRDRPNDAVGATDQVSGTIALDAAGRVMPDASRIVVDVEGLASDQQRRDGYVRRRVLEVEQHPTVQIAPREVRGLPFPLPATGNSSLEMLGDLTIRGITRPTTWQLDVRFEGERVTGTAQTAFTFADFELTQPRVPIVASVSDTIRLEYDFTLLATELVP